MAADGTFEINDLPETIYSLQVRAWKRDPNAEDGRGEPIGFASKRIHVGPRRPEAKVLDVGTLVLREEP